MISRQNLTRYLCVFLCQLLAIATLIRVWGQHSRMLLAFVTILLILLPELLQQLFRCRICLPVYLFALFYALGPMLGHCHNFYFRFTYWDKLLHIMGGIMFVILGIYLFSLMGGGDKKRLACGVFALCFSVAVAVIWEFFEFGMDQVFSFDMQSDTVITTIISYALGTATGDPATVGNIADVSVNGQPLPFRGYLDIGLLDTMADMLLETAGALLTTILFFLDRGRHRLIQPKEIS